MKPLGWFAVLAGSLLQLSILAVAGCGSGGSGTGGLGQYSGASKTLFDNSADDPADNYPTVPTVFLADKAYKITRLATYHWNYGSGKDALEAGGTVSLRDAEGTVYGPWVAASQNPDFWWECPPSAVVPAGIYTVVDSNLATWSFSDGSGGQGIAIIEGIEPDDDASPEVTVLATQELSPSASSQTVNAGGLVVTIPGDLLKKKTTLQVGTIASPSENDGDFFEIQEAWEVSLGALHDLEKPVTIELPYDPTAFSPDLPPEKALVGVLYDSAQRAWVSLPSRVDTERQVLVVTTDHLSEIGRAAIVLKDSMSNEVFLMSYDAAEVNAGTGSKAGWYVTFDPLVTERWQTVPDYVEDIWGDANRASTAYEDLGFTPLPRGSPEGYAGSFWSHPTRIFVGGSGSPSRSKFTKNVSISLDCANNYTIMRRLVAHEVFHCFQAQYYTMLGLVVRKWWVEATAEYASCQVAWGTAAGMGGELIHPGYLEKPLDYSAPMLDEFSLDSPHNSHAYNTAFFVDFLVSRKGINFKEMWEAVAKSYNPDVTVPLDAFLKSKQGDAAGLWSTYQEFAEYWVFDAASPVRSQLESKGLKSIATDGFDKPVPLKDPLVYTLGGAVGFASQLMRVPFEFNNSGIRKLSVSIGMGKAGMTGVAYAAAGDSVTATRRLGDLEWRDAADSKVTFELKQDEVLYLLLINGGRNDRELFHVSIKTEASLSTKTFTFSGSSIQSRLAKDIMQWPNGGPHPLPEGLTFFFTTSGSIRAPVLGDAQPKLTNFDPEGETGFYILTTPAPDAEVLVSGSATYEIDPSEIEDDHTIEFDYYDIYTLKEKRIEYGDTLVGNTTHSTIGPEGAFSMSISQIPPSFQGNPVCSNASVQVEFDFEKVSYRKIDDQELGRITVTYRPFLGPFGVTVCRQ